MPTHKKAMPIKRSTNLAKKPIRSTSMSAKPKRAVTPIRKRKTTTRKRGLADIMTRSEAESGFKSLVGLTIGFFAAKFMGKIINPEGEKDKMEVIAKLGAGFLISTTARMPSVGSGVMASGISKLYDINESLGDNGFLNDILPGKKTNYLSNNKILPTGITFSQLSDYTNSTYNSNKY